MKRTFSTIAAVAMILGTGTGSAQAQGLFNKIKNKVKEKVEQKIDNAIDKAVHANMRARGCKLKANEIYNADAPGSSVCDAMLSTVLLMVPLMLPRVR